MSSEGDNILLPAAMSKPTNQTLEKNGMGDVVGEEEEIEVDESMGQEDQKDDEIGNIVEERKWKDRKFMEVRTAS
jgi:hypothetical protein